MVKTGRFNQPDEAFLGFIADVATRNLTDPHVTARLQYGIEGPEDLIRAVAATPGKLNVLFADVSRMDAGSIAGVIKAGLHDQIDAATYPQYPSHEKERRATALFDKATATCQKAGLGRCQSDIARNESSGDGEDVTWKSNENEEPKPNVPTKPEARY